MKNGDYGYCRELAWKVLSEFGVNELPVMVSGLCEKIGVSSKVFYPTNGNDGNSAVINGKPYIFVDPKRSSERQRFTAAHELGHILRGHVGGWKTTDGVWIPPSVCNDREASVFATELLMPECVLIAIDVKTAEQIQELCKVSYPAAFLSLCQMQKRKEKDLPFLESESIILKHFHNYIDDIKSN